MIADPDTHLRTLLVNERSQRFRALRAGRNKGTVQWLMTFADLCMLILGFFVLLFSFTDINVSKFTQFSGALIASFGAQTTRADGLLPEKNSNGGDRVITVRIGDAGAAPTPLDGMTSATAADTVLTPDATELVDALGNALIQGKVEVVRLGDALALNFTAPEARGEEGRAVQLNAVQALEQIVQASVQHALAAAAKEQAAKEQAIKAAAKEAQPDPPVAIPAPAPEPSLSAYVELAESLRASVKTGEVYLVKNDATIIVTLGSAGSFAVGATDLTPRARELIRTVARTATGMSGEVVVSGHTDTLPITTGRFRDNWDLAAGRAASVVQEFERESNIPRAALMAISYGDSRPIAPNDTAINREKNRRVEIELRFRKP